MIAWFSTFPAWFWMTMFMSLMFCIMITAIVIAYRIYKYGVRIKKNDTEVDLTEENNEETREVSGEGN